MDELSKYDNVPMCQSAYLRSGFTIKRVSLLCGKGLKVKASTLIEVIVSMVIILTCLGIALTIFSNMSRDVNDELRILAEIRINTFAAETKFSNDFTDVTVDYENIRLQRSMLLYPQKSRLRVLYIEAFTSQGKKITEYKEIVSIENK